MHGVTFRPVLYRDSGGVACAQPDYLGFYAIQRALRGLFLGVNYLVGGNVLLAERLYGPAVAAYYTAAYHAVHGFLALDGRVFLDSTFWPIASHRQAGVQPDRYIAVLTRHNRWLIESRARNHHSRWNEVQQVYGVRSADLPECFQELFRYMYRGCYRKGVDLVELIKSKDRDQFRVRIGDNLDEFLGRIAETRHESLYSSFGSDPHVMEAMWNGDTDTSNGIEDQAVHFGVFALGLLMEVATDLGKLTDRLELSDNLRTALLLSVHHPWFDSPRIDDIANSSLRLQIEKVDGWVHAPVLHQH